MLERRSALASAKPYRSSVLTIAERAAFSLTQLAGLDAAFEQKLAGIVGSLPQKIGVAQVNGAHTILRIGPSQG